MIDMTASAASTDDARARSNVLRLAAAQALTGANSAVIFATGSIIGSTLAPGISLAPLALAVFVGGLGGRRLPLADRHDLAALWPPHRFHPRHRLRRAHRPARRVRNSA